MTDKRAVIAALCISLLTFAAAASEPPRVVVSIKPIHSLVAAVMQGIGEPRLLIGSGATPHTYSLRPSDARALQDADVLFWVGAGLETFLEKPLASLPRSARVIALSEADGVRLLDIQDSAGRSTSGHDSNEHAAGESTLTKRNGHTTPATTDMHIWLDVDNARAIVRAVAAVLGETDPARSGTYEANMAATEARLEGLDQELRARVSSVADRPYVVFHEAYGYLEHRYGLNRIGSVTVHPDRQPSAQRVAELRRLLVDSGAECIFGEPQFESALLRTLTAGTRARIGVLDAEGGIGVAPGPEAYFTIMRNLADALRSCLDARP